MSGWTRISFKAKDAEEFDRDDDGSFVWPKDEIQAPLVEQYGARTDSYGNTVYAALGGYRDWGEDKPLLKATLGYWDKAAILQANDTGDVGEVRVYQPVIENGDAVDIAQIDAYKESQAEDGYRVGRHAAAYASYHHEFNVRAGNDYGRGWGNTLLLDHEWHYKVLMDDPTHVGEVREGIFSDSEYENETIEVGVYETRHNAVGKAALTESKFGVNTRVEPVAVEPDWPSGIEQELERGYTHQRALLEDRC